MTGSRDGFQLAARVATLMKVLRLATFAAVVFMRVQTRSIGLVIAGLSLAEMRIGRPLKPTVKAY
jgi:hypothetical protein